MSAARRRRSRPRVLLLACAVLVVEATCGTWVPAVAFGAGAASETAALKHFEEGKKYYDAGEFELALASFQASLALLPSPNSRLYIGRCYRTLGKPASAYTSLRRAMREASDRLEATGEKRYTATRDVAAAEANELEPKVPRLMLRVPADLPPDFKLTLDGAEVPKEAWGTAVETDPGRHAITATAARHRPIEQSFELALGEQKTLDVKLARVPTATLSLSFPSRPAGLSVRVDRVAVDPSAVDRECEVDVGAHSVAVQAPGYDDFEWQGVLADHESRKVEVRLVPTALPAARTAGTPKWVTLGVGAVGVVSLGVASVFAFQARSASNAEQAKDPLERDPAEQGRIRSASTRANVLFVTGGVLVVGAGVLAFVTKWHDDEAPKKTGAAVLPWAGPSGAGVSVSGAF